MTKREHMPIGYDPRLDRRQPPAFGGFLLVLVLVLVLVVALVITGLGIRAKLGEQYSQAIPTRAALPTVQPAQTIASLPTRTETPLPTYTLDAWSLTGTAFANATASPTPEYCWWLTPTPTDTPTLAYTPDAWGATGTAVFEAEHPYHEPTIPPPRELCTSYPTWTPTSGATAVFTPFPFRQLDGRASPTSTATATTTVRAAANAAPSVHEVQVVVTAPPGPTEPPQIIRLTAPPPAAPPPQIIVVTATRRPPTATVTRDANYYATATSYFLTLTVNAPTATYTPSATLTPEQPVTDVPTDLPTNTPTPSETPTETPTDIPTDTPTETPTETPTDIPTDIPTDAPPDDGGQIVNE